MMEKVVRILIWSLEYINYKSTKNITEYKLQNSDILKYRVD